MSVLFMILLFLIAVFLIVLVLIQRGKGGGLAGAFGGMGGQSAFGTKAGDLFTRITIGVAAVWILLCIVSVSVLGTGGSRLRDSSGESTEESAPQDGQAPAPVTPEAPADLPAEGGAK